MSEKTTKDTRTTPAPKPITVSKEELISDPAQDVAQLRKDLENANHRLFQIADALAELSYLVDGLELLDHYADDNCLMLPGDLKEINACAALKEAAMDQIKTYFGALDTLATNKTSCVEI